MLSAKSRTPQQFTIAPPLSNTLNDPELRSFAPGQVPTLLDQPRYTIGWRKKGGGREPIVGPLVQFPALRRGRRNGGREFARVSFLFQVLRATQGRKRKGERNQADTSTLAHLFTRALLSRERGRGGRPRDRRGGRACPQPLSTRISGSNRSFGCRARTHQRTGPLSLGRPWTLSVTSYVRYYCSVVYFFPSLFFSRADERKRNEGSKRERRDNTAQRRNGHLLESLNRCEAGRVDSRSCDRNPCVKTRADETRGADFGSTRATRVRARQWDPRR